MKTLEEIHVEAKQAFNKADANGKKTLTDLFGKDLFIATIIERVKTIDDALKLAPLDKSTKELLNYKGLSKHMIAAQGFTEVSIFRQVVNEGWEPNWDDSSESKWYIWFNISGSGLSYYADDHDGSGSSVGSRLCYKSRELAQHAFDNILPSYKKFMLLNNQ